MAVVNVEFKDQFAAYTTSKHTRTAKGTVTSDAVANWIKGEIVDCKVEGGDTARKVILLQDTSLAANATATVDVLIEGDIPLSLYSTVPTADERDKLAAVGIFFKEDL